MIELLAIIAFGTMYAATKIQDETLKYWESCDKEDTLYQYVDGYSGLDGPRGEIGYNYKDYIS